jgi:arsenate reductase (thioredoxin)
MLDHWAAKIGLDVKAHSADSSPSGRVGPLAVEMINHAGIDTSAYRSKRWGEFSRDGAPPRAIVITVCDSAAAEACPVFFGGIGGQPAKVHWGYPDPSNAEVGEEGKHRGLRADAPGHRLPDAATAGTFAGDAGPNCSAGGSRRHRPKLSLYP